MTTEEKFNAAVNVIKGLPKNGAYQPSHDLMLRFYSYFKQATLGPCAGARPAFWDVVGRAKYDAWKNLGEMTKTDAMNRYVDELHSIVETMSYSDKVASFLNAPTGNIADLELVAGDVIQKVRSRSNSPEDSRNPSPTEMNGHADSWNEESPYPSESDTDHSDGDYVDTIEAPEPRKHILNGHHIPLTNGYTSNKEHSKPRKQRKPSIDISQEVSKAVQSLKFDIEALKGKVVALETERSTTMVTKRKKQWWQEVSPQLFTFMILWPFVTTFIVNRFIVNRRT